MLPKSCCLFVALSSVHVAFSCRVASSKLLMQSIQLFCACPTRRCQGKGKEATCQGGEGIGGQLKTSHWLVVFATTTALSAAPDVCFSAAWAPLQPVMRLDLWIYLLLDYRYSTCSFSRQPTVMASCVVDVCLYNYMLGVTRNGSG